MARLPAVHGPRPPQNPLATRIVRAVMEAYGVQSERDYAVSMPAYRRFTPTPRDVSVCFDVLAWLRWYERERDKTKAMVFTAWAFETPTWMLVARHQKSKDTLDRWRDDVAKSCAAQFRDQALDLCGGCAVDSANQSQDAELPPDLGESPARSQPTWVPPDAKPVPGAEEISGSQAFIDRARTVKQLRRNMHKNEKRKSASRRASINGSDRHG